MVKKSEHIQNKAKGADDQGNTKMELQEKIRELETKVVELENNWRRALADYQNLQKRTIEERNSFIDFSLISILKRILPLIDNLEMLNKHTPDEGIKMILKDFEQILRDENVTEIESVGKDFDLNTMEAIEMLSGEKNKVLEVIQKGYLYKNKLLRPVRVKVGRGKE